MSTVSLQGIDSFISTRKSGFIFRKMCYRIWRKCRILWSLK